MRGFFAVGAEGISKQMNLGNMMRSAHAFGASFIFTIDAHYSIKQAGSDTSKAPEQLPLYNWDKIDDMKLPEGCQLVGVELTDDAIELPSFRHPIQAAYIFGPERGSLTPQMQEKCAFIVKIPTKFCINVATAGAIIMYDRVISLGRFADRPVGSGGPKEDLAPHSHGFKKIRTKKNEQK